MRFLEGRINKKGIADAAILIVIMNLFLTTNMCCGCVWLLDERKFENHWGTIQSVCRKDCMIACRSMDPNRKCMWEWSVHHDVTFCLGPSFSSELRVSDVVLVFWMCKMLIEGWVWLKLLWGVNHEIGSLILIEAFCFFTIMWPSFPKSTSCHIQ